MPMLLLSGLSTAHGDLASRATSQSSQISCRAMSSTTLLHSTPLPSSPWALAQDKTPSCLIPLPNGMVDSRLEESQRRSVGIHQPQSGSIPYPTLLFDSSVLPPGPPPRSHPSRPPVRSRTAPAQCLLGRRFRSMLVTCSQCTTILPQSQARF